MNDLKLKFDLKKSNLNSCKFTSFYSELMKPVKKIHPNLMRAIISSLKPVDSSGGGKRRLSERQIASKYGVSKPIVWRFRAALALPKEKSKQIYELIQAGKSNRFIARETDTNYGVVQACRDLHNMKSVQDERTVQQYPVPPRRPPNRVITAYGISKILPIYALLNNAKLRGVEINAREIAQQFGVGVTLVRDLKRAINLDKSKILLGVRLFRHGKSIPTVARQLGITIATTTGLKNIFKVLEHYRIQLMLEGDLLPVPGVMKFIQLIKKYREETGRSALDRHQVYEHFKLSPEEAQSIEADIRVLNKAIIREKVSDLTKPEEQMIAKRILAQGINLIDASIVCFGKWPVSTIRFNKYPLIKKALIKRGLIKPTN